MKATINKLGAVPVTSVILLLMTTSGFTNGVVHSVHVGGPDVCEAFGLQPGCDMNFSMTAQEFSDGSVSGRWVDIINVGGIPLKIIAAIDCLHVNGNQAWVSGIVVGPDAAGARVATRIMDNGVSANDVPDMSSFTFGVGNAFDCRSEQPFPLLPYVQGQVIVQ